LDLRENGNGKMKSKRSNSTLVNESLSQLKLRMKLKARIIGLVPMMTIWVCRLCEKFHTQTMTMMMKILLR
jgi:hypothetical protein